MMMVVMWAIGKACDDGCGSRRVLEKSCNDGAGGGVGKVL